MTMDRTDQNRAERRLPSMYGLGGDTWPGFIGTFASVALLVALVALWLAFR